MPRSPIFVLIVEFHLHLLPHGAQLLIESIGHVLQGNFVLPKLEHLLLNHLLLLAYFEVGLVIDLLEPVDFLLLLPVHSYLLVQPHVNAVVGLQVLARVGFAALGARDKSFWALIVVIFSGSPIVEE